MNIIFAVLSYFTEQINGNPIINTFLAKGVIFCFYTFSFLFNLYVILVSKNDKEIIKKNDNKKIIILYILIGMPILFLNIYYYHSDNIIYSYGPCANYEYVVISLMIFYWFILLIKNFKNVNHRKSIPIIAFVILLVVVAIIQKIKPELKYKNYY